MTTRPWMLAAMAAAVAAGVAGPARAGDAPGNEAALLPVEVVSWEAATNRLDAAEVVLLCLVGAYDPSKPSEFGPSDSTPAQMLERYLDGVRRLGAGGAGGTGDAARVKILIVEGGEENRCAPTREKARRLHQQLKVRGYDMSIPVIYVFQRKALVDWYSYARSPGWTGTKLRATVAAALDGSVKAAPPVPPGGESGAVVPVVRTPDKPIVKGVSPTNEPRVLFCPNCKADRPATVQASNWTEGRTRYESLSFYCAKCGTAITEELYETSAP